MKAKKPTKIRKKNKWSIKSLPKMIHACISTIQKQKLVIKTREEKINITKDLKYSFCNRIQVKRIEENNLIYSQCEFYSRSRTKCTDFILGIIS